MSVAPDYVYTAEVVVYDPSLPGERTLYYSTRGFATTPAATPASTYFDGCLKQPAIMRRDLFASGSTSGRSRVGFGDLVLSNPGGALDALLDYGFDGRALTIRQGVFGAAYPSAWLTVFVGTMQSAEFSGTTVTIKLRDRQAELDIPLQPIKYAGTNSLPAGLEGVANDLKGKPKPVLLGAPRNVPAPFVNTTRLISEIAHQHGPINLLKSSEAFISPWSAVNTPTRFAASWTTPVKSVVLDLLGDDNGSAAEGYTQPIVFTGNGTKRFSAFIRKGSAASSVLGIYDSTASAYVAFIEITWSGAAPVLYPVFGTVVAIQDLGGTDYRILMECTAANAAHTFGAYVYPATDRTSAINQTGDIFVGGLQAQDDLTSWEYAVTTASATAAPAALTSIDNVYDRGVSLATAPSLLIPRTSGFSFDTIYGAVYGNGLWVAVGGSGKLSTSATGVVWVGRTSGFGFDTIRGVAYGNGYYVAVGDNGKIYRSANGTTGWTAVTTPSFSTTQINAITFGDGLFVAVGHAGKLATSTDGDVWTQHTSGFGASNIYAVCYGRTASGGRYIAAGQGGIVSTSADALTWASLGALNAGAVAYNAVTFTRDAFVLVGDSTYVYTSETGLAWTNRTAAASEAFGGINLMGVAHGNGLLIASDLIGKVAQSRDGGRTWTKQNSNLFFSSSQAAAFGGGIFVLVGQNGGLVTTNRPFAYTSLTDVEDDTIAPDRGTYKTYAPGGYSRNGSPPEGLITADATQGASAADRTAGQLFANLLDRAGFAPGEWSDADVIALDTANSAVLGFWTADETTVSAVLERVANSVGAWWGADRSGVYRIKQFTAPSGSSVRTFTAADLIGPPLLTPANDADRGIPVYRVIVKWGRVYAVQTTDLDAGVTDADRAIVGQEWRQATATDLTVQTAHPLAPELIIETLLTTESDALAEAARLLALRGVQRRRYTIVVEFNSETATIDLGDVVTLDHARFGLSGGVDLRVIGLEPDTAKHRLSMQLWG